MAVKVELVMSEEDWEWFQTLWERLAWTRSHGYSVKRTNSVQEES